MNHPTTDAETIWREQERDARPGTLDTRWRAMSDAIDRLEHASMVARETDNPFWDAMAAHYEREATAAIAAYEEEEAAIADEIARADEQAADEAREEAIRYAWAMSAAGQAAMRARDEAADWGGF